MNPPPTPFCGKNITHPNNIDVQTNRHDHVRYVQEQENTLRNISAS
jgi:hypothetical protein